MGSLPKPILGARDVLHCGYHSESSYGAASYLIQREGGNVLADSPRFDAKLLKRIQVSRNAAAAALGSCAGRLLA